MTSLKKKIILWQRAVSHTDLGNKDSRGGKLAN